MLNLELINDRQTVEKFDDTAFFKSVKTEVNQENRLILEKCSQNEDTDFWKLWVRYQDYLYKRCLNWMKDNHDDAQEALSRASIKGWEKWLDYAGKIANPRAWMTRLTHNLCMDMHRERNRGARGVESIENVAAAEDEYLTSSIPSPESAVLHCERDMYIRRAVDALPAKLRTPFILRYYQEMSYQDIAEQLVLSNDNVRKQVQQGRRILQQQLNKYFHSLDDSSPCLDPPCAPLKKKGTLGSWEVGEDLTSQTPMNAGCTPELINYKVTATCLEVLSDAWYNLPNPLGWR